jgi:hypothetical protein
MKGIISLIQASIVTIVVVGAATFLFWILASQFIRLHVIVQENLAERQATNLANVILSHEAFASSSEREFENHLLFDGQKISSVSFPKINRGMMNSTKLDKISYKVNKEDEMIRATLSAVSNPITDLDIGYPNSIAIFAVVDLEDCKDGFCKGWIGSIQGPITLEGLTIAKFVGCLKTNVKPELGLVFRVLTYGILGLWYPDDLVKCSVQSFGEGYLFVFSKAGSNFRGIPVLIDYGDEYHIGRLFVGVMKWV